MIWSSEVAQLPVAMYHAHAVVVESTGTVYVGGGSTTNKEHDDTIFKYQDSKDWDQLPPCPVTSFGLAAFGNSIVTVGGRIPGVKEGVLNHVYTYDESNGKTPWKGTIPNMPTARHSLTVLSHDFNLYACGGKNARETLDTVEIFKSVDKQWITTAPLPFPCHSMSCTVIHSSCYLLGGYDQYSFTNSVLYASLTSLIEVVSGSQKEHKDIWRKLPSVKDNCATAASFGGCLLAIGGFGSSFVKIYSPLNLRREWVKLTKLPEHVLIRPAVADLPDGNLLVIGGAVAKTLKPQTSVTVGRIVYH